MKTIADLKRAIKPGVKMHAVNHRDFKGYKDGKPVFADKDMGEREVSIAQTNSFAFKTWREDKGQFVDSWCDFPKAKDCKFNEDGSFTVMQDDHPILTYRFIPA